jgi:hypothetical protein
MSMLKLEQPFLDSGVRSTYFFNGRILSREDMAREQTAEQAIHDRLGLAVGDGIVRGLEVIPKAIGGNSAQDPVVTVKAGLAINRLGQTLGLDKDVDVSLLSNAKPTQQPPQTHGFKNCKPTQSSIYVVGSGVYLLSMSPAQAREGLAVVSGLGNGEAPCNAKAVVDTVSFHLSEIKLTPAELSDVAHLRNVVAYKFFLAEGAGLNTIVDPFGPPAAPLPSLTEPALSDCDVPLGVVYWTSSGGIRFVDLWAVRRTLHLSRRQAVGLAMRLQFQQQLAEQRTPAAFFATVQATYHFLPPVGLVPLGTSPGNTAFDVIRFFTGLTVRGPLYMEGARVESLLQTALTFAPIDARPPEPNLVWLYQVRENRQRVSGRADATPYVIFARGEIDYQGEPRFNVSHFSFANFSLNGVL